MNFLNYFVRNFPPNRFKQFNEVNQHSIVIVLFAVVDF